MPDTTIRSEATAVALDIPFAVPFTHRLRFTEDVLGGELDVLLDLLEPSGPRPPRVQVWIDDGVATASPGLAKRLEHHLREQSDRLHLTNSPFLVPGGEELKNDPQWLEYMLREMDRANLDRRSYVVVIGGGAVLDAVGFAVAVAHRGLRLVRLPTTTLAQGDSGVGVKCAVNLFDKKNWAGSFAVPWGVINDTALLAGLSDRDFVSGFSESVKVSLLKSETIFNKLCESATKIQDRDLLVSVPMIRASVELHMRHITEGGDPFEFLEARPLDFGHWSAHKLEPMTNFAIRHGEAVGIGVALDVIYSSLIHGLDESSADRVLTCLAELGLPLYHAQLDDHDVLFRGLEEFRQHLGGRLTVTMLRGVGDPIDVHEVDFPAMRKAIEMLKSEAHRRGALFDLAQAKNRISEPRSAPESQCRAHD